MASPRANIEPQDVMPATIGGDDAPSLPTDNDAPTLSEPPPEKPSETRRRTLVVLSYWLLVLCLGLPIWWRTTAIYRAHLPLDKMVQWAEGKACRPVFPLHISIHAPALQPTEGQNLLRLTQHALDDLNDFSAHHLRLNLAPQTASASALPSSPIPNDQVALSIQLVPGGSNAAVLDPHSPLLNVTYAPNSIPSGSSSLSTSTLASFMADQLRAIFAEEQSIISYLLSTLSADSRTPAADAASAVAKRTTRSLRYAPTYHLTFSLFAGGPSPSTWDVDSAIDDYVRPVLDVLAPIHNFTIDTQVQLYAVPGTQTQVLAKDDLASFINAAEWPLSPSIGGAPTVNFLTYVGNQTVGLAEGGGTSQSWLVPQWGAVYLLPSPPSSQGPDHLPASALKAPMLAFAAHLLSLLGTPSSGSLPLRLSTLSRIRSADVLLRASSTLGALARLVRALPSISIPSSVADGVAKTMHHLELACAKLGEPDGLKHARIAEEEAERAFFEKSMVGQLYFPDEHKIAVYLPLLGPVGVPLVIGLLNEVKRWRQRRKKQAEDEARKSQ